MYKIYLALALGAGLLIAYVDTLPHWDDTGITVFALLLSSGLFGLLTQRRPWLVGLAVGLWIPLHGIIWNHDFSMLFVLIFPMAGAFAGWGLSKIIRKTWHPV